LSALRQAGLPAADAEKLAWADQYTDDLTEPDLHGIQTQSAIAGRWLGDGEAFYRPTPPAVCWLAAKA
jgi:hypothetical protein